MMNPKYMPYLRATASVKLDMKTKDRVVALAVAAAVAASLPVPSSPVDSAHNYFNSTHAMTARDSIGEFNEQAVFNVGIALEHVRRFWMYRYNVVHQNLQTLADKDFLCAYTGASMIFSDEDCQFMNENAMAMSKVMCAAKEVQILQAAEAVAQANRFASTTVVEAPPQPHYAGSPLEVAGPMPPLPGQTVGITVGQVVRAPLAFEQRG